MLMPTWGWVLVAVATGALVLFPRAMSKPRRREKWWNDHSPGGSTFSDGSGDTDT